MLAISTGGIGPMDISQSTKAKGTSKEEEKAMEAFASLMDMVSTKQDVTGFGDSETQDVNSVITDKSNSSEYESYMKENSVKSHKYENGAKTVKSDNSTDNKDVETFDVNDTEKAVQVATDVIKDVKEILTEELGISEEELESLLADMGISIQDLFTGTNLKDFILQISNATEVDLLINEDVAKLLNNILDKFNSLLEKFGITDVQSFVDFVEENQVEIMNQFDSVVNAMVTDINAGDDDATNTQVESDVDGEETVAKANNTQQTSEGEEASLESKIVTQTTDEGSRQETDSNPQIATNLSQAIDNAVTTNGIDATAFVDAVQEADIIRQIIDQIKVTVSKDVKSMELQLNPEQLGKVQINVVSEEGVMHTKIIAETEAAKQAIENNIAILKEAFNNNDLKVESIEVMVASYGYFDQPRDGQFDEEQQNGDVSTSKGSINVNELSDDAELTEEEELQVEMMKSQGNSVSYLA